MTAQLALPMPATAPVPAPAGAAASGPTPLVIGLDVSLSCTGVAGRGWAEAIRSGARLGHERLAFQLDAMRSYYRNAELVVIEGAAFSRALQRGHDELAAIRWMARHDLWKRGIPYAVVPPDNRTIYATGRARWTGETPAQVKGRVRDAVLQRYGVNCTGPGRYDQADASILAEMGLAYLGHPGAVLPPTHTRALAGVDWPERSDT
ncbi:unknown [Streptomyces phage mu1/6]|uniref:RuvC-like Holliday junction resolvase n=1 Tax=Streptomyces phage mu1/6 TaxID=370623 RepID=UPI0000D4F6BE|nr:RuvC-like Holliday junction resolvase [Streptomyces phage mu1/6]ABD94181.1 unknown [Streptomyces phage mu1/6]